MRYRDMILKPVYHAPESLSAQAQRVIRGQGGASWQTEIKGQIYEFARRFGFVLEIYTFNLSEIFFFSPLLSAADVMVYAKSSSEGEAPR